MAPKQACDVCHKRKIQCDSTDPKSPCNWCEHHGLVCTFNRVRGRRKKKTESRENEQDNTQTLSQRLKYLEETLAQTLAQRQQSEPSNPSAASHPSTPSTSTNGSGVQHGKPTAADGVSSYSMQQTQTLTPISQPSSLFPTSPVGRNTTSVSFSQIHFGGCHFGQISQHNGMPILSEEGRQYISSKVGEEVSFDKFRPLATQKSWLPNTTSRFRAPDPLCDLPSREIVQEVAKKYQASCCSQVFPILDPDLFQETLDLAFEPLEPTRTDRFTARACVFSFLAVAVFFQEANAGELLVDYDSEVFAARALHMLVDVMGDNSLAGLQAVFLMHLYQLSTGQLQSAAALHSLACRGVFTLGGHAYKPIQPREMVTTRHELENRQLRLLFWLCYIFDKDMALRLNQPPVMADDYCDLTLPEGYANSVLFVPRPTDNDTETRFTTPNFFPGELRLSRFKDKVARTLYSASAVRKTEAELFRDIRQLDDELENWRQTLSLEYRPSLSISKQLRKSAPKLAREPNSMRRIVLHLEYHHLMTTIHRASGRCSVSGPDGRLEGGPFGVVQSSIALTLEASRSTLIFLRTATQGLVGEAFWVMVFYPTAAIMALFLNVLQNPLAPQATSDLELLLSAAQTIKEMPVPRLTSREIGHMQMVDEFVHEVVRLGNRAIACERERGPLQTAETSGTMEMEF